jgi:hypothetical protein
MSQNGQLYTLEEYTIHVFPILPQQKLTLIVVLLNKNNSSYFKNTRGVLY